MSMWGDMWMFTQNVKQLCGLSVWHKLASPLSMSLWKRRRPCQPARELGRSSFARESQIYWVNEHKGQGSPVDPLHWRNRCCIFAS